MPVQVAKVASSNFLGGGPLAVKSRRRASKNAGLQCLKTAQTGMKYLY